MHFRFASSAVAQGGRWELPNGSKSVVPPHFVPTLTCQGVMRSNSLELLEYFSHWFHDPTYPFGFAIQQFGQPGDWSGLDWLFDIRRLQCFSDSLCHLASKMNVLRLHLKIVVAFALQ